MNRVVNTDFTGDVLTKMKQNNLTVDDRDQVEKDLFYYTVSKDMKGDRLEHDEELLVRAIVEILIGFEDDKEVAKYLDDIDSTFIYHKDYKRMSKRELMCSYMNTICVWTNIYKNENDIVNDEQLYKICDLYSGLKNYILNVLNFSKRKLINYQHFKRILRLYTHVKPSGTTFQTIKLSAESVCGLPQHKKN